MTIEVELSEADIALAWETAEAWLAANQDAKTRNLRVGDRSDVEYDFIGVLGEIAFGRHFGVEPDLAPGARRGTPDFVIRGVRIDVKATLCSIRDPHLLATLDKKETDGIDVFVLVLIDEDARLARIAGWAHSSELLRDDAIVTLKKGRRGYGLPLSRLHTRFPLV